MTKGKCMPGRARIPRGAISFGIVQKYHDRRHMPGCVRRHTYGGYPRPYTGRGTGALAPNSEKTCMGTLVIFCPFCRAELSSNLNDDQDLRPSPTVVDRFYKHCPSCTSAVAFTRTAGGQLLPMDLTLRWAVSGSAALAVEPFSLDCPLCRSQLSPDIDNDPAVRGTQHDEDELYKTCPNCRINIKLKKLADNRLALADWSSTLPPGDGW